MSDKLRLDKAVAEQYHITRHQAAMLIREGKVYVNGAVETKAATAVSAEDAIETVPSKYVCRAAKKLLHALEVFDIQVDGLICTDIGASTGGFTQVLLEKGASFVYAVDVGHGQLHPLLQNDARVKNMEGVNARGLVKNDVDRSVDFVCCDASFISLTLLLETIYNILSSQGKAVLLIKPQFEAGPDALSAKGVVRSWKVHEKVIQTVMEKATEVLFSVRGLCVSPVVGEAGNIEYLLYLQKNAASSALPDVAAVVKSAEEYRKGKPI